MSARAALDEFNDVPAPEVGEAGWLRFVTAADFAAIHEPSALPILGDGVITAGSNVLIYGDGGAGKTSLELDAAVHLATGTDWIGFDVPRPFTVAIVENEGPRGPFRAKLARKLDHWANPVENLYVLEEPWAMLRLDRDDHLDILRAWLHENTVDVLMLGPAASSGFTGPGSPDEIELHAQRLQALRQGLTHPLSVWLIHHENKQGDVSGAWERLPDTFLRVRAGDGGGYTVITWKKTRWSSEFHGRKMILRWADGDGFELVDANRQAEQRAAEVDAATDWLVRFVTANPGHSKREVEDAYVNDKDGAKGARARIREAVEKCLKPAPALNSPTRHGETEADDETASATKSIRLGPGKSPSGKYLYPASTLDSPTRQTLFGEYGESDSGVSQTRPESEYSPLAAPLIGSGSDGELASAPASPDEDDDLPFS